MRVLVITGQQDPMWPFLLQAATGEEKKALVLFATDHPRQARCTYDPAGRKATFDVGGECFLGEEVSSVWFRRIVPPDLSHLNPRLQDYCVQEHRWFVEGLEYVLPNARWVSRPSMVNRAFSKPFQLALARQLGAHIPTVRFTNDPVEVRRVARQEPTVFKAIRSPRVPVREDAHSTLFTTVLTEDRLRGVDGVTLCPGIIQRFVEKTADIRVTVFGTRVFAASIDSQSSERSRVDFRLGARDLPHSVHELPDEIAWFCRRLVRELDLEYGALDFALMSDGSYVFFEINSFGQWGWLEDRTGQPMRRALLDLLFSN